MANAIVTAAVNRSTVGAALRQFRIAFADHRRELNAVNRAALNLESCLWQWDGATLVVESATETGRTRYHVTSAGCECRAAQHGRPCWHVSAYRLLQMAAQAPAPPRPSFEELTAAVNAELFA